MKNDKIDILKLLEQGKVIQIKPQGYSMYPMFIPDRDSAIIVNFSTQKIKRGDVVLYRREESVLVLHRVVKVKGDGIYLIGDNQDRVEGPILKNQIKGILTAFIHNNKEISVYNPIYLLLSRAWLILIPCRKIIRKVFGRTGKDIFRNK